MKRHFSMLREFHLADWFTLANAFCGTGAVFAALRFLQVTHRCEHRARAAEGVGQGEPVGQVELAKHRKMAGHVGSGIEQGPQTAKTGVKAATCLRYQRGGGIENWLASTLPATRGWASITASTVAPPLPSSRAHTWSSAAYTYGSTGT